MNINLLIKKTIKKISYIIASISILLLLLLQLSPLVQEQKAISPSETNLAKNSVKKVMDQLASHNTFVEFTFSPNDLDAISKLGTHLLPSTRVMLTTSSFGLSISTTTKINFLGVYYLNNRCLLINVGDGAQFEECKLGSLPVPGVFVQGLINSAIYLVMGEEVSNTFKELLTNVKYSDKLLTLNAKKSKFFKEEVNQSISKVGDLASYYTQSSNVPPELVQVYLDEISTIHSRNLSDYLTKLFALAANRTLNNNDAVDENTAIIWALAVAFGDYKFASLIGLKRLSQEKAVPLLRGRDDLTKHFIYSAALQQLGDIDIGLSIGEAKELLDSNSGGSGFSFADLAADKAGLALAKYITSNNIDAINAQMQLKSIIDESPFFPFIHDLPEGLRGSNFKRIIESTSSDNYKKIEQEVDKRIEQLALYQTTKNPLSINELWQGSSTIYDKFWFKTDTHVHTDFSDGSAKVVEIAKQASHYGCDAIAITDHGDYNLKKVVSNEYFNAIESAQKRYPYLTIMPGLEWNIPPMNGREHATLILPKTANLQRNLSAFRSRYDHFKRYDQKVLSPEEAFKWLDKNGQDNSNYKPLVIYNHPSRKDWQLQENSHDFTYWRNFTDLVIGFSGSPGHQKKRKDNNGSYEYHLKTINGWDPAVANIGGEWDTLLQQGYKVWAARAGSDFHNTKMDYWPCQFSSTHILAKSNEHNHILSAYRSGAFWAQHGDFINKLDFTVNAGNTMSNIGQQATAEKGETISVNLTVKLNDKDWQGNDTSLDEIELIIITEDKVESFKFNQNNEFSKAFTINHQYEINSEFAIFRWRGRSIQPELHHYLFYTNPIKVIAKN